MLTSEKINSAKANVSKIILFQVDFSVVSVKESINIYNLCIITLDLNVEKSQPLHVLLLVAVTKENEKRT